MKNTNVTPPKKKNTLKGFPPFYFIAIGAKMMQIVAPSQFIIVANGTIFAGIIYGTYNQVTGPTVSPKMNKNNIKSTKTNIPEGYQSLNTNSIPIAISINAKLKLPKRVMILLPNTFSIYKVNNAPIKVTELIIIGT